MKTTKLKVLNTIHGILTSGAEYPLPNIPSSQENNTADAIIAELIVCGFFAAELIPLLVSTQTDIDVVKSFNFVGAELKIYENIKTAMSSKEAEGTIKHILDIISSHLKKVINLYETVYLENEYEAKSQLIQLCQTLLNPEIIKELVKDSRFPLICGASEINLEQIRLYFSIKIADINLKSLMIACVSEFTNNTDFLQNFVELLTFIQRPTFAEDKDKTINLYDYAKERGLIKEKPTHKADIALNKFAADHKHIVFSKRIYGIYDALSLEDKHQKISDQIINQNKKKGIDIGDGESKKYSPGYNQGMTIFTEEFKSFFTKLLLIAGIKPDELEKVTPSKTLEDDSLLQHAAAVQSDYNKIIEASKNIKTRLHYILSMHPENLKYTTLATAVQKAFPEFKSYQEFLKKEAVLTRAITPIVTTSAASTSSTTPPREKETEVSTQEFTTSLLEMKNTVVDTTALIDSQPSSSEPTTSAATSSSSEIISSQSSSSISVDDSQSPQTLPSQSTTATSSASFGLFSSPTIPTTRPRQPTTPRISVATATSIASSPAQSSPSASSDGVAPVLSSTATSSPTTTATVSYTSAPTTSLAKRASFSVKIRETPAFLQNQTPTKSIGTTTPEKKENNNAFAAKKSLIAEAHGRPVPANVKKQVQQSFAYVSATSGTSPGTGGSSSSSATGVIATKK